MYSCLALLMRCFGYQRVYDPYVDRYIYLPNDIARHWNASQLAGLLSCT